METHSFPATGTLVLGKTDVGWVREFRMRGPERHARLHCPVTSQPAYTDEPAQEYAPCHLFVNGFSRIPTTVLPTCKRFNYSRLMCVVPGLLIYIFAIRFWFLYSRDIVRTYSLTHGSCRCIAYIRIFDVFYIMYLLLGTARVLRTPGQAEAAREPVLQSHVHEYYLCAEYKLF